MDGVNIGTSLAVAGFLFLMAAPYPLRFRAIALTLRAGWHSQPLMVPNFFEASKIIH